MATSSDGDKIKFNDTAGPSSGTRAQTASVEAAAKSTNNNTRKSTRNKGMKKSALPAKGKPRKKKENKQPKFKKECINPECPRKCEKFKEAPRFALAFFYTQPKPKSQLACDDCYEQAVAAFEKMGNALLNNLPIADVKIPQKQEIIEIEDSDEEEPGDQLVPNKNKMLFDENLEAEVEFILNNFTNKIDLRKQAQSIKDDFTARMDKIESDSLKIQEEITQLRRSGTKFYDNLYAHNKRPTMHHSSIDIEPEQINPPSKPEFIDIAFDPPKQLDAAASPSSEEFYYAIRLLSDGKRRWAACRLLDTIIGEGGKKTFKVEFVDDDGDQDKQAEVCGKELALNAINENLRFGARVIARFFATARNGIVNERFLPGVVGEYLCDYNKHRYLIFCDYGHVRYSPAKDVREMAETSQNVWEDCHPNLQYFIREYLQSQKTRQRRLLNLRVNQQVPTEHKRKWHEDAVVLEVDASLAKIHFPEDNSEEWLYRGSKRFAPLFTHAQRARRKRPSNSKTTIGKSIKRRLKEMQRSHPVSKNEKFQENYRENFQICN